MHYQEKQNKNINANTVYGGCKCDLLISDISNLRDTSCFIHIFSESS